MENSNRFLKNNPNRMELRNETPVFHIKSHFGRKYIISRGQEKRCETCCNAKG